MRGDQGVPGTTGATGATGARGPIGRRGPAGPSVSRDQMLAAVGSQFAEINKRLETQLTRIAQLQQEIDLHRRELLRVRSEVGQVHDILQTLIWNDLLSSRLFSKLGWPSAPQASAYWHTRILVRE